MTDNIKNHTDLTGIWRRLKPIQMLFNFIAFWFFIYGFQTLSYLRNTELYYAIKRLNFNSTAVNKYLTDQGLSASDLSRWQMNAVYCGLIGLFVAFVIAALISYQRKWGWANALIALVVIYILWSKALLGWRYVRDIVSVPERLTDSIFAGTLLSGILLLSIGMFFLFSGWVNRLIEGRGISA
jgi:hypothetical protein